MDPYSSPIQPIIVVSIFFFPFLHSQLTKGKGWVVTRVRGSQRRRLSLRALVSCCLPQVSSDAVCAQTFRKCVAAWQDFADGLDCTNYCVSAGAGSLCWKWLSDSHSQVTGCQHIQHNLGKFF